MTIPKPLYPLLMGEEPTEEMKAEIRQIMVIAGTPFDTDARKEAIRVIKMVADAVGTRKLWRTLSYGVPRGLVEEVLKDD